MDQDGLITTNVMCNRAQTATQIATVTQSYRVIVTSRTIRNRLSVAHPRAWDHMGQHKQAPKVYNA